MMVPIVITAIVTLLIAVPVTALIASAPVSYTHLTLPTN